MRPLQHGQPWTENDDQIVYDRFTALVAVADIARELSRSTGGIRARLRRLGLVDEAGKRLTPPPPFSRPDYAAPKKAREIGDLEVKDSEIEFSALKQDDRYCVEHLRDMMSARLYNHLCRLEITDIRQAFRQPPRFFLRQKNFGSRTLRDLQNLEKVLALEAAKPSEPPLDSAEELLGGEEETAQMLLQTLLDIIHDIGLSPRDDFILTARLGMIPGYERFTLAELGTLYSISRERIRQIQNQTMRRLLHRIRRNGVFAKVAKNLFPQPSDAEVLHFCERHFSYPLSRHMAALLALKTGLYSKHSDALNGIAAAGWIIRAEKHREARALFRQDRQLKRHFHLFRGAFHPPEFKIFAPPIAEFSRKRDVNEGSAGRTGAFFSKKCQRDIFYESNEEYLAYQIMEESPKIVWYQEQPTLIPFHFFAKSFSYCPDLAVVTGEGQCFVIEVKIRSGLVEMFTLRKALAALGYLHPKGIGYILTDSRGTTLPDLAKIPVPPLLVQRFDEVLSQSEVITYANFKKLSQELKFSSKELYSLIINHDLCFERYPLRISRLPADLSFKQLLSRYSVSDGACQKNSQNETP